VTPAEIRAAVQRLNSRTVAAEEQAWSELRGLGEAVVPYLREAYPTFKRWQGRVSLVFHSIRYGRVSEDAFQLGLAALHDRATVVRYRACGLLAYSLREDALSRLNQMLRHDDAKTAADAKAAITAISKRNHHLFVDRDGSGRSFWVVNEEDRPPAPVA
jgi:hypothetical protein